MASFWGKKLQGSDIDAAGAARFLIFLEYIYSPYVDLAGKNV